MVDQLQKVDPCSCAYLLESFLWNYDFHCIFISSFSPTETTLTEIGSGSCHGQGLLHSTMSTDPLCRLLSYTKELSLSKPIGLSRKGGRREERRPLLWDFINSPVTSIRVNYVGRTWRLRLGIPSSFLLTPWSDILSLISFLISSTELHLSFFITISVTGTAN